MLNSASKPLVSLLILSAAFTSHAAETGSKSGPVLPSTDSSNGLDIAQFIDVLSVRSVFNGSMEFNELTRGEVDLNQTSLFAVLGVTGTNSDLKWVPAFNYRFSSLDVSALGALPRFDNSLHEITLPNFLLYNRQGSPWVHGMFSNFGIRSDLGTVDSRDFFLAAAIGSGYRFSDNFMLGLGVYASDLTNAPLFMPAPVFAWTPTEDWLISFYGPRFIARRELGPNVRLGFEASWNGGSWNVDSPTPLQDSVRVDMRSFRTGFFYRQRLIGELWGEIGAGYSFANELKVNSPGGRDLFPTAYGSADSAPYFSLGLSLNRW